MPQVGVRLALPAQPAHGTAPPAMKHELGAEPPAARKPPARSARRGPSRRRRRRPAGHPRRRPAPPGRRSAPARATTGPPTRSRSRPAVASDHGAPVGVARHTSRTSAPRARSTIARATPRGWGPASGRGPGSHRRPALPARGLRDPVAPRLTGGTATISTPRPVWRASGGGEGDGRRRPGRGSDGDEDDAAGRRWDRRVVAGDRQMIGADVVLQPPTGANRSPHRGHW